MESRRKGLVILLGIAFKLVRRVCFVVYDLGEVNVLRFCRGIIKWGVYYSMGLRMGKIERLLGN